ncbi:MAG: hypothetical protein IT292_11635 [Deltaproteobacteria bacterium]|nr:hypothetical protein [Deltaproteobacteria bacterium]
MYYEISSETVQCVNYISPEAENITVEAVRWGLSAYLIVTDDSIEVVFFSPLTEKIIVAIVAAPYEEEQIVSGQDYEDGNY